jgi:hypothetical protein
LPEGVSAPRARRRITQGGTNPSSEVENHRRGTAAGRLVGRYGFFGLWAFPLWAATSWRVFCRVRGVFICVYYFSKKRGFPWLLGDPYGCRRHLRCPGRGDSIPLPSSSAPRPTDVTLSLDRPVSRRTSFIPPPPASPIRSSAPTILLCSGHLPHYTSIVPRSPPATRPTFVLQCGRGHLAIPSITIRVLSPM